MSKPTIPTQQQPGCKHGKLQLMKMKGPVRRGMEVKRSILAGTGVGPSTPVPSWKLYDNPFFHNQHQSTGTAPGRHFHHHYQSRGPTVFSARKLAATLWELEQQQPRSTKPKPKICNSFHRLFQNDSLMQSGIISTDKPTHMDCPTTSVELFRVYNRIKVLEEQQSTSTSVVQSLRTELDLAHARVQELEFAQKTSRKEIEHLLKKLAEERTLWRSREQERIRAAIQTVKEELECERKTKRKLEIFNRKMAKELADAKLAIAKHLQDLDKERKAREIMEDVCDELAKEIGGDKAEAEELRRESTKLREEFEEERRMLQMVEVWREERVQMKLTEARFVLEEKNLALENLRSELERFLKSRRACRSDDVQEAELLRDAVSSVRIHEIRELSCQPSESNENFSTNEDLHLIEISNEALKASPRQDDHTNTPSHSPENRTSNYPVVSPELQGICISPRSSYSKANVVEAERQDKEDEEDWDSASGEGNNGEQGSSDFHQETEDGEEGLSHSRRESEEASVGQADDIISQTETDVEDNEGSAIVITELEAYSATEEQLRQDDSSVGCLWRPNSGKGDFFKTIPMEISFPTPRKYSISSQQSVVYGAHRPSNVGRRNSVDTGNPHIARGIKGFIEWPRGIRHNSLKARLLEAKVESQKAQLRQVLKKKHLKA